LANRRNHFCSRYVFTWLCCVFPPNSASIRSRKAARKAPAKTVARIPPSPSCGGGKNRQRRSPALYIYLNQGPRVPDHHRMGEPSGASRTPPPEFTESGPSTSGPVPSAAPPQFQQFEDKDFPESGELPIPHINPALAHVRLSYHPLIAVSPCCPQAILRTIRLYRRAL
jgi:hypothetical protein